MALVQVNKSSDENLAAAGDSNVYQIGGKAGSVQIDTANSADFTSTISLSNNQSSWKTQATVYTTDTTDIFQFGEGIEFLKFTLSAYTTGDATYTINLNK